MTYNFIHVYFHSSPLQHILEIKKKKKEIIKIDTTRETDCGIFKYIYIYIYRLIKDNLKLNDLNLNILCLCSQEIKKN